VDKIKIHEKNIITNEGISIIILSYAKPLFTVFLKH